MTPLYIFDLDGTLSITGHRQHLLEGDSPDWDAFFEACEYDDPNTPVINTLKTLRMSGADIYIWSGRSSAVRKKTYKWLYDHDVLDCVMDIKMRKDGDFTPDDELKKQWLNDLIERDEQRLVAIFDDRDKVVEMWRSQGIACFQVERGSF